MVFCLQTSTRGGHIIHDIGILVKEFLESERWDVLNFLFKNLVHWIPSVLEDINEIHDLLFSQFLE